MFNQSITLKQLYFINSINKSWNYYLLLLSIISYHYSLSYNQSIINYQLLSIIEIIY